VTAQREVDTVAAAPARRSPEVLLLLQLSQSLVSLALRSMTAAQGQVNLQQFRALRVLDERGPCTAGALAAALELHPSSVTRLVDRLVAAELVTREVKPENRREISLDVTRAGRRVVGAVLEERARELQAVVDALPTTVREQLREVLPALVAAQQAQDDTQPGVPQLH